MAQKYTITTGAIRVRVGGERRDFLRGFEITTGDKVYSALGKAEVDRLVRQGWLKVAGLREGLERGTAAPAPRVLPSEVRTSDPAGEVIAEAKFGKSTKEPEPRAVEGPDPNPGSPRVAGVAQARPDEFRLPGGVVSAGEASKRIMVVSPGMPQGDTTEPGAQPVGIWTFDPAHLAGKPVGVLNALIQDRDADGPAFGEGEEQDAVAFMSADFRSDAPPAATGGPIAAVSGDAVVDKPDRAVRVVPDRLRR